MNSFKSVLLLCCTAFISACQSNPPQFSSAESHSIVTAISTVAERKKNSVNREIPSNQSKLLLVECPDIRPTVCTREFSPVCATKKTSEKTSYSNACAACADLDVVSYTTGEC